MTLFGTKITLDFSKKVEKLLDFMGRFRTKTGFIYADTIVDKIILDYRSKNVEKNLIIIGSF